MKKVYVGKARNGKGIFALKGIKKSTIFFFCRGKIIKYSNSKKIKYRNTDAYGIGHRWVFIGNSAWLSPFRSNLLWYLNHSCNPNAGRRGKFAIVAMRNIRKGEEITLDYSVTEEDPYWKMKCNCGEKNCRKIVQSISYLPYITFTKYKPYIPKFLADVYKKTYKLKSADRIAEVM